MEYWLIPISFFSKRYFSINTLAIFPLIIYTFFLCYLIFTRENSLSHLKFSKKTIAFVLVSLLSQTGVELLNYERVRFNPGSPNLFSGVFFGSYLVFFNIIVVGILVKFLMDSNDIGIDRFIKSFYVSLIFYGFIVLLPQLLVVVFDKGNGWVNFLGKLFEERHTGRVDFYYNGSYATTLKRINGFCSEASFLAAQLGIVFLPILMASIKNNFNLLKKKSSSYNYLNWFLLLCVWVILLFAKTSTGILVIFLSIIILFIAANTSKKVDYFLIGIIGMVAIFGSYFMISPIREIINNYLLHKSGVSNRLGGTIALLLTFLHHPVFGVGNNYESFYLMKFVPKNTTNNWEFQEIFKHSGYPVQSEFFSFFAHFGLIIMIPVIIYLVHKLQMAHKIKKYIGNSTSDSIELNQYYTTLVDAFYYFVIMYICISFFSFGWFDNYYLIMFFFYVTVVNNIAGKVNLN